MRNKKLIHKSLALTLIFIMSLLMLTGCSGCGKKNQKPQQTTEAAQLNLITSAETEAEISESADELIEIVESLELITDESTEKASEAEAVTEQQTVKEETTEQQTTKEETTQQQTTKEETTEAGLTIKEDGRYTSKEEVALYIHTYGKLPSNYITKKEAQDLGWASNKGNLWDVTDGMSIGGDRFGNYEELLPTKSGRKYYECDINYNGGYRGSERIIYSNDGLIFYTNDHYETFEQLY